MICSSQGLQRDDKLCSSQGILRKTMSIAVHRPCKKKIMDTCNEQKIMSHTIQRTKK